MTFTPYRFSIPTLPKEVYTGLKELQDALGLTQHGAVCLAIVVTRDLLRDGQGEALRTRMVQS